MSNLNLRGYITSRSFLGERIPQSIQSLTIRDYCNRNNYNFLLHTVEYAMKDTYLILTGLIEEMSTIDGIATYSIFQLPYEDNMRNYLLNPSQFTKDSGWEPRIAMHDGIIQTYKDLECIL